MQEKQFLKSWLLTSISCKLHLKIRFALGKDSVKMAVCFETGKASGV